MPELPEVETVARDLRGLILGATLVSATCLWPRTLRSHAPESFAAEIAGRRVESVGRRGKQVMVRLSGDGVLTIHLKMTGQLFVGPPAPLLDPYVRLVIGLADGREIRFRDIRKFGRVGLYAVDPATGELIADERSVASGLVGIGPEPLHETFSVRAFRERLSGRRGRLKPLLLDQGFVAGIGNIYADEALWAARLHPLRHASSLRGPDQARLYRALRSILTEAVRRRGSSVDDYTAPDGDGEMQERLVVYQRAGEPCPRCGRPIRRIVIGARSTHFCSWCQRLPADERAGSAVILRTMTPRGRTITPDAGPRWIELRGADGGVSTGSTFRAAGRARAVARGASTPLGRAAATRNVAATRKAATRRAAARAGLGPSVRDSTKSTSTAAPNPAPGEPA